MPQCSQSNCTVRLQYITSHRREERGLQAEIAGNLPLAGADRVLVIHLDRALGKIRDNMADKSGVHRWDAVRVNKSSLKRIRKFGLNLYGG